MQAGGQAEGTCPLSLPQGREDLRVQLGLNVGLRCLWAEDPVGCALRFLGRLLSLLGCDDTELASA